MFNHTSLRFPPFSDGTSPVNAIDRDVRPPERPDRLDLVVVDGAELRALRRDARLLVIAREVIHAVSGIPFEQHLEMLNTLAGAVIARRDDDGAPDGGGKGATS